MRGRVRRGAPIAAVLTAVLLLAACTSGGAGQPPRTVTVTPTAPATSSTSAGPTTSEPAPSTSSSKSSAPQRIVHVHAMQSDGATYGVGMPIVLFFSPPPTDSTEFTSAVTVTVDGRDAGGAWYWEQPTHDEVLSNTVEAHYRLPDYWPANSSIHVDVPIKGLSAGKNLAYSGALTSLDFGIGDRHVATVDGRAEKMLVYSNNHLVRRIPVSLGEAEHPTYTGVKVVMQKGENIPGSSKLRPNGTVLMSGDGYTDTPVAWSVRITLSGEYVHSAPWNGLIGTSSTSHGCTNLFPDPAKWFYHFANIGDVLTYANTGGTPMRPFDGLGDWNISWAQWAQGGLLLNH